MKNFFKRTYLATVMLVTSLVASLLKSMVAHVIELKGLDLNPTPALPSPSPEPTVDDLWNWSYTSPRKQFTLPYVPKWVAASLRDPTKHPGFHGKVRYQSVQAVEVPPFGSFETTTLLATEPTTIGQLEGHAEVVAPVISITNNESMETISGTPVPFNNIH
jgi:hypothetical protein